MTLLKTTQALPQTMQALVVSALKDNYAGVAVQDITVPQPAAGEVLVQVKAATLGFPDLLMTHGGYQHKPPLPFIPGGEMAGEVAALGEAVSEFAIGDAVTGGGLHGGQNGAFCEYALYNADALQKKPPALNYGQAASVSAAYLTAYVSLVRRAHIEKGEWLLVHGAAGGVGLAAVDLGKRLGARVIACVSSDEKLKIIEQHYQPDIVLNSRNGFREQVKEITGGGADVIYDPVGGDVFDESVRCIAWGGRLLVVGFASGRIPQIGVNMPLIKGFSVVGVRAGEFGRRDPAKGAENMAAIWEMAGKGEITPYVHKTYALHDWQQAFAEMDERRVVGRLIFDPSL